MQPSPEIVLVNGAPSQSVSPLDRGLHFGDGLFETVACLNGRPRFLSMHLERLLHGCERLGMDPAGVEGVRADVRSLARDLERAIVKIIVTRGVAAARGYGFTGSERATRVVIRYAWPQEDEANSRDGVRVRTVALRMGENPALAGLKHTNRLEQILARAEWADRDIAEGIVFGRSGNLVSGTMSNLFIVRDSRLLTPRLDFCGVAGVMRRVVLREALRAGIDVQECELRAEDLGAAEEIFLTNARIGIWPVRELDSRAMSPGSVTRRLQEILVPLLEEPADA